MDTITGDLGDDVVVGGLAGDSITGDDGDDVLVGDYADLVFALAVAADRSFLVSLTSVSPSQGGVDDITGGNGGDLLVGGAGGDQLDGSGGVADEADVVVGDYADIVLFGPGVGSGFVASGSIDGLEFAERLHSVTTKFDATGGVDVLWGGNGDDVVVGGLAADTLRGQLGDDVLVGDFEIGRAHV